MFRYLMGLPYRDRFDFLRLRGCFDEAGSGGTGGGGAGAGAGAGAGGSDGGGGAAGAGAGAGKNNEPFATFPDEASFMRRISQASRQELEKMAKDLGFESADAMKAAAKAKKEADEAAKTELEKEKARAEKAEQEKKDALAAANTRLVNAEIKVFAVQVGFVDPADAVALVDRTGIQVDEKGNVSGAKEAVDSLAKAKPHLVGKGKPDGSPGAAGNGSRQDGSGGNQAGEFGKQLAVKRAEEAKKRSEGQVNYFK